MGNNIMHWVVENIQTGGGSFVCCAWQYRTEIEQRSLKRASISKNIAYKPAHQINEKKVFYNHKAFSSINTDDSSFM